MLTVLSTLYAEARRTGDTEWSHLLNHWPFSATLLLILLTHELGHFFTARYHHVDASLPYFIPIPNIIGTFGAFIRMRSPIFSKRALVHIGASGPIAGMVVAVPVLIWGLQLSEIRPLPQETGQYAIFLGDNLLFGWLSGMLVGPIPEGYDLYLHPVAYAGWIGLFVTSLNLIPVGQLDGGHIAYSLLGRRFRLVGLVTVAILFALTFKWFGWFVWASMLLLVIGLRHPPPLDSISPLDGKTKAMGLLSFILFILTFTPNPIQLVRVE